MSDPAQADALHFLGAKLSSFGRIALSAVPMSRALFADGLEVLSSQFGGLLSSADEVLDPVLERFEVELLRERFGSAVIFHDGELQSIGYRSAFLDELLGDAGVVRDQLENLRRPAEVDERLVAHPWARRYLRHFLVDQRSVAMVEAVRMQMELAGRSLGHDWDMGTDVRRVFLDRIGPLFAEHGFKRSGAGCKVGDISYSRPSVTPGGMPVNFSIELSTLPKGRLPISVSISMQPVVEGDYPLAVAQAQGRGDFFRIVEPLVPNFGRYRSALTPAQFSAQLYAYEQFLSKCLPVVMAACDE